LPPIPGSTTTTTPPPRPAPDVAAAARRLLVLVNNDRSARGLPALARRSDVDRVAANHSQAMADRYDIWHNDAFFTAASKNALGAAYLGENVAMNSDVDDMHRRLMASPHHRENILDGRFTQVGIGVAAAPDGKLFATEDFVQPRAGAAPAPAAPKRAARSAPPAPRRAAALPVAAAVEIPVAPPVALDTSAAAGLSGGMVKRLSARPANGGDGKRLPAAAAGLGLIALVGLVGVTRFGVIGRLAR
jgi:hypothetical protein